MNKDNTSISDLDDLNEFIPIPAQKKGGAQKSHVNKIYQKNLEALGEHHPELVDMIESVSVDENRIKVVDSESGNPRIIYKKADGEEVGIHSSEDPVSCANGAIELLGSIDKEGIVVLFGFGLGYFAEEVFNKFEKGHMLLIYEATPEIFKFAMEVKNLSEALGSEKVKIILGEDADNFSVIHNYHHLVINGKFWVVEHKPSIKLNQKAYENFFKRLNEEKTLSDIGVITNVQRGKEFIDACLSNVNSIIRKPGVSGLEDVFKGCTAIVVSAGPSLDKNVHLLKKAKGKAVIIATGGALSTLLSSDIVPDLLVEIDPVSDNIEDKFQGIPELKRVPFVSLCQYTPELVKMYPGPMFINSVDVNIAYQWLKNFWEEKGRIECFGGSVAHLAFAAAEYIGADVIGLVGQDLSYTSNRLHTVGYSDDLDRRMEAAAAQKQANILGGIPVCDIFGEDVLTIRQFLTFITAFENRIKISESVVINVTEAGLPIIGAVNMRLMDFIDEYCNDQKEMDTFSVLSGSINDNADCRLDDLLTELTLAKKQYESIKRASSQIMKHVKKVKKLKGEKNDDSHELNNVLSKINKLIKEVRHPSLNLLVGYNYGLELYMKKQEIQDIDDIDEKWEMLDKQLERGQVYYNELIKTINRFNKQLAKVITALKMEKKIDSILNDIKVEERERFYKAGMLYKNAGMAAQAEKYLEAALQAQFKENRTEEGKDSGIYISLAEMYIEQLRFYDAQEILKKIRSRKSEDESQMMCINKLLKVCNKKISVWEERKKKMGKLLEEAEINYGSHLESGYFYFRIKDFERAEKAYLKATESGDQKGLLEAYYGLAHSYLERDNPENAVSALEKAIETDPSNPLPYRDLGLIAIQNDSIESAEVFLSKAIEQAPYEAELYKPLAGLYMEAGESEKAVALYENAIHHNPDNPAMKQELAAIYKETIA